MSALTRSRPVPGDAHWLDEHASRWVDEGLLTEEQALRIREVEQVPMPSEPAPTFSLGAEVAVYLGSVLALAAGAVVIGESWSTMAFLGQLLIGLAITGLCFGASVPLSALGEPGTRRLASFMWLIGCGGMALTIGTLVDGMGVDTPAPFLLAIGIPLAIVSAALWRNLDRPLQVLSTAIGVGLTIGGVATLIEPSAWLSALVLMGIGAAVIIAATTAVLRPELYVMAVGSVVAIVGAFMLTDLQRTTGFAMAILVAAAVVTIGLARHLTAIVVIGVIGFLEGLQGLFMTVLRGPVASLLVAVIGLATVIVVITRATRKRATSR